MPKGLTTLELALLVILAGAGAYFGVTYLQFSADRARYEERIKIAQETRVASEQLAKAITADLQVRLGALEKEKRATVSPARIIERIPQYVNLPVPLQPNIPPATPQDPKPEPISVTVPAPDLKPLYDALVDGRMCQEELAGTKLVMAEKDVQIDSLKRENAETVKLAKGGSLFRRIGRGLKWVGVGVLVGVGVARAVRIAQTNEGGNSWTSTNHSGGEYSATKAALVSPESQAAALPSPPSFGFPSSSGALQRCPNS